MTGRMPDFLNYKNTEYWILGLHIDKLPQSEFIKMGLPAIYSELGFDRGSRSFFARFSISPDHFFMVNSVEITNTYPYQKKLVNQPLLLDGYVLFGITMDIYFMFNDAKVDSLILYEMLVKSGEVIEIEDIASSTSQKLHKLRKEGEILQWVYAGSDAAKIEQLEKEWDLVGKLFPRKYNTLRIGGDYFSYPRRIADLKESINRNNEQL